MFRQFLLFIALSLLTSNLIANNIRNINVKQFTVSQGLSHNSVYSIFQDENGFIWIGTINGLNRYDGTSFETFYAHKDNNLKENNIKTICGDMKGHLFIKGLEGLYEYNIKSNKFRVIQGEGVSAIHYANNMLWYSVEDSIFSYNPKNQKSEYCFSLKDMVDMDIYINNIILDDKGRFCLGSKNHGLYIVENSHITEHYSMGEVYSLLLDWNKNLWVSTRAEGVYFINIQTGLLKHYTDDSEDSNSLPSNNVRNIQQLDSTTYCMSTYEGLVMLDTKDNSFCLYHYDDRLNVQNVRSVLTVFKDRDNAIWLGSFYDGLHYYNSKKDVYDRYYVRTNNNDDITRSLLVSSITEDEHGNTLMATEGGGIFRLNEYLGTLQPIVANNKLSKKVVKSIYYENGELWASTLYDGVDYINTKTNTVTNIPTTIIKNVGGMRDTIICSNIVAIDKYNDDTLLLGGNNGLMVYNRKTNHIELIDFNVSAQKRFQVWDIIVDDESIWLTTSTDLYRYYPGSKRTKVYSRKSMLGSNLKTNMYCGYKDDMGRLWFGSSGSGLFLYDRDVDSFINYGIAQGLANGYITNIYKENGGSNLIISTIEGISTFDTKTYTFDNFSENNGFPFSSINIGGLFLSRENKAYAFTSNSVISIESSNLKHTTEEYDIYFTDLYINNKHILPEDGSNLLDKSLIYKDAIYVKRSHSSIGVEVRANNFNNSYLSNLEYRLYGFDSEFRVMPKDGIITYTNLDAGDYKLVVRDSNTTGMSAGIEKSLNIVVENYLLLHNGFILLYALIILTVIYMFFKAYTARITLKASLESEIKEKQHIEEVNQSKLRFFTNVAHEFRTPLTLMNAQLELLLEKKNLAPNLYSKILNVYKSATGMRRLVDEIIDLRRQELGFVQLKFLCVDLNVYLKEVYCIFEAYAKNRNVKYTINYNPQEVRCELDTVQFEKVINNLLSNAFKYTGQGDSINIEIKSLTNTCQIIISDTGIGIPEEDLHHIFERFYQVDSANEDMNIKGSGVGLSLVKSLVEQHNGTINVESNEGKGTRFTVTLNLSDKPLDKHYAESSEWDFLNHKVGKDDLKKLGETLKQNHPDNTIKMLIVEDNEQIRTLLSEVFSNIYEVSQAQNGKEALSMVHEMQPDIVLSDIMMPVMSGVEMCVAIKSDKETSHIPVVLLTARTAEEHIIEGLELGADDYILKPFNISILVARCNNLIASRARLQQKYRVDVDTSPKLLTSNTDDLMLLTRAEDVVKKYISDTEFNISIFARELGLSRTYLFTKIKGVTGQTPNEFILNIRLKESMKMLRKDPAIAINSLAFDCGFNSSSYYIKCFKCLYSKTPNMVKKELMAGKDQ